VNRNQRDVGGHDLNRSIHLAVAEQGDRTFVTGLVCVVMNQLMQLGTRRHGVQKQDKTRQQQGENRLAGLLAISHFQLQTSSL